VLMDGSDLRDQISRLEIQIDELAKATENCRRIILISKVAICVGAVWMLALVLGVLSFAPLSIISAISAVIFGIVSFGSHVSTSKQNTAIMKNAETLRTELINRIELEMISEERGR
jgi:hypothetical protein